MKRLLLTINLLLLMDVIVDSLTEGVSVFISIGDYLSDSGRAGFLLFCLVDVVVVKSYCDLASSFLYFLLKHEATDIFDRSEQDGVVLSGDAEQSSKLWGRKTIGWWAGGVGIELVKLLHLIDR